MSPTRSLKNIENKVGGQYTTLFHPTVDIEPLWELIIYFDTARNFGVKGFNKIKEGAMYAKLCLHFVP